MKNIGISVTLCLVATACTSTSMSDVSRSSIEHFENGLKAYTPASTPLNESTINQLPKTPIFYLEGMEEQVGLPR